MRTSIFKYLITGILLLIGQVIIFRHLQIFGSEPDMVFIFVLFFAHYFDRTRSLIIAAVFGLAYDAFLDLWGLHMFAKVLTVMLFYQLIPRPEESKPQAAQVLLIMLVLTFFHNGVFLGVSAFVQSLSTMAHFWEILIGKTVFTTIVGTFLYFFKSEQN